jgi:hypothetical protein
MLKSQVNAMRKNLKIYHHYATQSGFGVDSRGVVTASPSALNEYYACHAGSSKYANLPLVFYEELLTLFGRENK